MEGQGHALGDGQGGMQNLTFYFDLSGEVAGGLHHHLDDAGPDDRVVHAHGELVFTLGALNLLGLQGHHQLSYGVR